MSDEKDKNLAQEFVKGLVGEKGSGAIVGIKEDGSMFMIGHGHPIVLQGLLDHFKRLTWARTAHQCEPEIFKCTPIEKDVQNREGRQ